VRLRKSKEAKMHERKKKDGHRKDKKMERMREDVKERKENAAPKVSNDQKDIQTFKPGAPSDKNRTANQPPPPK
jgi:hypothetical protein